MNVCTVLNEIERLAERMVNLPQSEQAERVRDYTTIRVLIQELEELDTKENEAGNPTEQLQQLTRKCRVLAGISDEVSTTEKQAYSQARKTLHSLRIQFGCDRS